MKFFATALAAAAYQAQLALGAELGQSCVTGVLGKVFSRINLLRKSGGATSTEYVRYAKDVSGATLPGMLAASPYWTMLQNGVGTKTQNGSTLNVVVLSGAKRMTDAAAAIGASNIAPSASEDVALKWAEGLALGNAGFVKEWAAVAGTSSDFSSLTTPDGTTSASRANAHGTVTGAIVESAYFFDAYSLDATDLMNFIITNDGNGNAMRASLFGTVAVKQSYTAIGMGIGQQTSCTPTHASNAAHVSCKTAFIVTLAKSYANAGTVAACQPTISYGGGICDPDTWAGSVWEQMQDARVFAVATWKPLLTAIASGCSGMACTYDWTASGSTSSQTILSSAAGVTAAATAVGTANLTQFKWFPALFLAAKDQTTYLKTASDVASTHGDSTLTSRAAKYGTAGAELAEGIYKGTNSAQLTVARLLINDNDATNLTFRKAFLLAGNDQAGASCATHTDAERVCTVLVGAGFVAGSAYEACTTPAVAAAATTPTGATTLAAGVAAAAALAALF